MRPAVSVIVPIYNVEKYLPKCIESIVNQTLTNIEIILVDDGSTDNSGKIAAEYSKKDQRIKVIYKENGGQGSARNIGLDISSGEYIGFVDSDDWIDKDMYEKLYLNAKEKKADITVCNRNVYDHGNNVITVVSVKEEVINDVKNNIHEYVVEKLLFKHTVVVYNKIYKADVLKNTNIRFKEVKEVGSEDALFNCQLLLHVNKISAINSTYHNQLAREGSTAREYKIGAMERTARFIEELYRYTQDMNEKETGDILVPIMLIFLQQWNYNLLKTYQQCNLQEYMVKEQRLAEKNKYFKKAEKDFISKRSVQVYIDKMGYSKKGKVFIKLYMILSLLGLYRVAIKLRTIL